MEAHPGTPAAVVSLDLLDEFGGEPIHPQIIRDIRGNRTYKDLFPEIERVPFWDRSEGCKNCKFFTPGTGVNPKSPRYKPCVCALGLKEFDNRDRTDRIRYIGRCCSWFTPIGEDFFDEARKRA